MPDSTHAGLPGRLFLGLAVIDVFVLFVEALNCYEGFKIYNTVSKDFF